MDIPFPKEHLQYHHKGGHHKNVSEKAKLLLRSMLWGPKPGKNILCYLFTYK